MNASAIVHPAHTFYGGAHLFKAETLEKLSRISRRLMDDYLESPEVFASVFGFNDSDLAANIYHRVQQKLERSAIEDFRIDFEDGYGVRSDEEEDADASRSADVLAEIIRKGIAPNFYGFRVKGFSECHKARAMRTLEVFISRFADQADRVPEAFRVTLPKVQHPDQVLALSEALSVLEEKVNWPAGTVKIEVVVECPQLLSDADGRSRISDCIKGAQGRCVGLHLGPYDLMAACGISSGVMGLTHPVCDHARMAMLFAAAETGVGVCDGATHEIPVPPHRGDGLSPAQRKENRDAMHRVWKTIYGYNRHGLTQGFYQGWDLHPGHLISRYTALYAFLRAQVPDAVTRLERYRAAETQASLTGQAFDDAASARGVEQLLHLARASGAVDADEVSVLRS